MTALNKPESFHSRIQEVVLNIARLYKEWGDKETKQLEKHLASAGFDDFAVVGGEQRRLELRVPAGWDTIEKLEKVRQAIIMDIIGEAATGLVI